MRDLNVYIKYCTDLLDTCNIPYEKRITWSINNRATGRWGQCRKRNGRYSINISSVLLNENSNEKDLINTVIHELIHTCPDCMNHGNTWKTYANKVNRKYGYDISRTNRGDDNSAKIMMENKITKSKYVCYCEKCGTEFYYQRWCNVTKYPERYKHTGCGGSLKLK